MSKGFDCFRPDEVARDATTLAKNGYGFAAVYLFASSAFKRALTKPLAQEISKSLYLVSVWENGFPTTWGYFSQSRGHQDGQIAVHEAINVGQPAGSCIYFAVDYDAGAHELAAISAYFTEAQKQAKEAGYVAGVYGSGLVCQHLKDAGLVSKTWLAQSTGFAGFHHWKPKADIVQGPEYHLMNMDADADTSSGAAGGWKVS